MIDQGNSTTPVMPQAPFKKNNNNKVLDILNMLLGMLIKSWYWILLSMFVCLAVAWFNVKMSPNVYTIAATMQINSQNREISGDILKMFRTNREAEKEIHFFHSRQVIQDVVKELNLHVSYVVPHFFADEDIYDRSPIDAYFMDNSYPSCNFHIKCNTTDYVLTTIESEKGRKPMEWTARYGDTLVTARGILVVQKRPGSEMVSDRSFEIHYENLDQATNRFMGTMRATVVDPEAGNIRLTMNDGNLQRGKDAINLWIDVYNRHTVAYKNKVAENTAKFIQERIEVISVELSDVEGEIADYMKEHNITDLEGSTSNNISNKNQYSSAVVEGDVTINVAKELLNKIKSIDKGSMLPNIAIGSGGINSMIEAYNKKILERQHLLEYTSEKSPLLKDVDSQIGTMKSTIISSLENYIETLQIRRSQYRQQEHKSTQAISIAPSQKRELQSISRQQTIKEQLYLYLLNKREENNLKLSITDADTRVIDYASGYQISPNPGNTYTTALLIGFLIPLAIMFLIKFLDVRIHTKKDVEDHCSLSVTGMIPEQEDDQSHIISKSGKDRYNENYRILRNNIQFVGGVIEGGKVFMLTSARSGDGKSTTSYNLALTFAYAGAKVLLINTDIRKRESWHGAKEKFRSGLTTYLTNKDNSTYETLVEEDSIHPELKVIHNGPIPPNPAELLMSPRLDALIEKARKDFDYIIIDSVPIDIVADAFITNRVADATFFVIREKSSDRRLLTDLEQLNASGKLKDVSIILNGFRNDRFGYGYGGYGYGYGYGESYGYGYGENLDS